MSTPFTSGLPTLLTGFQCVHQVRSVRPRSRTRDRTLEVTDQPFDRPYDTSDVLGSWNTSRTGDLSESSRHSCSTCRRVPSPYRQTTHGLPSSPFPLSSPPLFLLHPSFRRRNSSRGPRPYILDFLLVTVTILYGALVPTKTPRG